MPWIEVWIWIGSCGLVPVDWFLWIGSCGLVPVDWFLWIGSCGLVCYRRVDLWMLRKPYWFFDPIKTSLVEIVRSKAKFNWFISTLCNDLVCLVFI